ncbi:hypothetical protein A9P82_04060 [Arachidicoccus ginsenosidimutans]|nr:hypothetical protein A9P82_04060 [Arachidicoccus sp. BS20]
MEDRIAIQDLVNAYAHYADNREAKKQSELFTENAVVKVYYGKDSAPQFQQGREVLEKAFGVLKQYEITTHFNGQSTAVINGDSAFGEAYCLAHHIKTEYGKRTLLIMSIRYHDKYVKQNGKWLFSERDLFIDWTDKRILQS